MKIKTINEAVAERSSVKVELETILEAFEGYILGQDWFDIVYSKKFGYLWVSPKLEMDYTMKRLNTAERMLESFFHDIISDVVFSPENPTQEHKNSDLTEYEERESRRRITAILETINNTEDRMRYLDLLDAYIKAYPEKLRTAWVEEE